MISDFVAFVIVVEGGSLVGVAFASSWCQSDFSRRCTGVISLFLCVELLVFSANAVN
ncbi:13084_t:CDS:1, partial [Gigaspora rosea]